MVFTSFIHAPKSRNVGGFSVTGCVRRIKSEHKLQPFPAYVLLSRTTLYLYVYLVAPGSLLPLQQSSACAIGKKAKSNLLCFYFRTLPRLSTPRDCRYSDDSDDTILRSPAL
jgi:hypothetical protein